MTGSRSTSCCAVTTTSIHAVTRRIAGPTRDADDATQEALIKIVRSLPKFDGRSSFGTWAYRIATNAALDELRKRKRRPALHAVRDDGDTNLEPVDEMSERRIGSIADRLALDDALAALPEDYRSAVVLRDVGDLDYAEIAEVLDIPVGNGEIADRPGSAYARRRTPSRRAARRGGRGHVGNFAHDREPHR